MLRPLLTDRFKLIVGHEQRELPVYAMAFARSDRSLGPQFHRSTAQDCVRPPKAVPTIPQAPEDAITLACGAEVYLPGHLAARGMPLSIFFLNISRWTDRIVVDRTGLEGTCDWDLQWTPEELTVDAAAAPSGPSLIAAVRDQAGFKLDAQRGLVDSS